MMVAYNANYTYPPNTAAPASGASHLTGYSALSGGSTINEQTYATAQSSLPLYRQSAAFQTDVLRSQ